MVTKVQRYAENYTTIGVAYFKIWAAEVYNDFAEELKHTETNLMC